MKIAHTSDKQPIQAEATAPATATCPFCGGVLTLRSRRPMKNGQITYYWRHASNSNRHCSARHHPVA